MTRHLSIILLGVINIIHASFHVIQVVQSVFIATYSLTNNKNNWAFKFMESPVVGFISLAIGIFTVIIGIRDYKHHKHHKD